MSPIDLTPIQKAFADRILYDVTRLLEDDQVVLDLIRRRIRVSDVVDRFAADLYAGVKNYDLIRTEQISYIQDELRRVMNLIPQSVMPHSAGSCPDCRSVNGFHASACERQEFARMQEPYEMIMTDSDIHTWAAEQARKAKEGSFDTSFGHGCDECGNTHGDAHSPTCKRGADRD